MRAWLKARLVRTTLGGATLAVLSLSLQASQQNQAPPTGAISGVVTDAVTRQPLSGAIVTLELDKRPERQSMLRPPPLGRQLTDSKGRFVFRQLPASDSFKITTTKLGYFDGGYGKKTADAPVAHIVLADGQWISDVTVEMTRPGAIVGAVVDERGEPVVGAYVRALQEMHVAGRPHYASGPIGRTDDRGVYRIAGLVPGRYVVFVPSVQSAVPIGTPATTLSGIPDQVAGNMLANGQPMPAYTDPGIALDAENRLVLGRYITPPPPVSGRAMAYPPTFYPNGPTIAGATSVELSPGADRIGVDIRLQAVATSRVSGVVQSPTDLPGNMVLRLIAAGNQGLGHGTETATALVGPRGAFTFLNVPDGQYVIDGTGMSAEFEMDSVGLQTLPTTPGALPGSGSASGVPSGPPSMGLRTHSGPGGNALWATTPVAVAGHDVTNIAVVLQPTISLSGRLVFAGRDTKPLVQTAFLTAEPANGDPALGMPYNDERNDLYAFHIAGLLPGPYVLRVRGFGIGDVWTVKSITAGGRDITNGTIDGGAGRSYDDIVITFTDETTEIRGGVVDAKGAPPPLASGVIAFSADRAQWMNYGFTPTRISSTLVTSNGSYKIRGLPAGDYFLVAVDEAHVDAWQDPAFLESAARQAIRVTVGWGDTRNADLKITVVR